MQEGKSEASPVRPGEVLAGRYRVERVLGQGGMGVVVEARHVQLDEPVAVKFLLSSAKQDDEVLQRFLREAKAAARLRSEHVVRVTDIGTLESGAPYMVMELLAGSDMAALIRQRGRLPIEEAVGLLLQACEGIAEAHAIGIVHRDLKPSNLFVTTRTDGSPLVKILDFGIAKAATDGAVSEKSLTATSAVLGSPLYMSPEQVHSAKLVDARSDIWSLGVILHEMLSGASPFDADTLPGVIAAIIAKPPPPLAQLRPDVSPELEAIVKKALQKDRDARYRHVGELAADLARFASGSARVQADRVVAMSRGHAPLLSTAPSPPPVTLPPGAPVQTASAWDTVAKPQKSGRGIVVVAVAVAAVAVIALGVVLLGQRGTPAPERVVVASSPPPAVSVVPVPAVASVAPSAPAPVVPPVASEVPAEPVRPRAGWPVPVAVPAAKAPPVASAVPAAPAKPEAPKPGSNPDDTVSTRR